MKNEQDDLTAYTCCYLHECKAIGSQTLTVRSCIIYKHYHLWTLFRSKLSHFSCIMYAAVWVGEHWFDSHIGDQILTIDSYRKCQKTFSVKNNTTLSLLYTLIHSDATWEKDNHTITVAKFKSYKRNKFWSSATFTYFKFITLQLRSGYETFEKKPISVSWLVCLFHANVCTTTDNLCY